MTHGVSSWSKRQKSDDEWQTTEVRWQMTDNGNQMFLKSEAGIRKSEKRIKKAEHWKNHPFAFRPPGCPAFQLSGLQASQLLTLKTIPYTQTLVVILASVSYLRRCSNCTIILSLINQKFLQDHINIIYFDNFFQFSYKIPGIRGNCGTQTAGPCWVGEGRPPAALVCWSRRRDIG